MRTPRFIISAVLLTAGAWGCAPAGGGGGSGGGSGGGGMTPEPDPPPMMGGTLDTNAEIPSTSGTVSDLMREAIDACLPSVESFTAEMVATCAVSPGIGNALEGFAELHDRALESIGSLPGRNLGSRVALSADDLDRSGEVINILACTNNPLSDCAPGDEGCATLNALALRDVVFTMDPLLGALVEGSAWWAMLAEGVGPDNVDVAELFGGLGEIFYANSRGLEFTVVNEGDASALLDSDPFAQEVMVSALSFLVFHELGHANLEHAVISHAAILGVQEVLTEAGRELSESEAEELERSFFQTKVATETQADIYAATLLAEAGLSSRGAYLFALGLAAYTDRLGVCQEATDEEAYYACVLGDSPTSTHPPLNVRATLVRRIVDDGEDLTGLLSAFLDAE